MNTCEIQNERISGTYFDIHSIKKNSNFPLIRPISCSCYIHIEEGKLIHVCACMCVLVYVLCYVCVGVYVCMYVCMYVNVCVHVCIYVYMCMHVCACVRACNTII